MLQLYNIKIVILYKFLISAHMYTTINLIKIPPVFLRCVSNSTLIFDGSVPCPGLYGGLYGQNLPYKFKNSYGDFWNRNFEKSHRTTGSRSDLRPDSWSWANSGLDSTFGNVEPKVFGWRPGVLKRTDSISFSIKIVLQLYWVLSTCTKFYCVYTYSTSTLTVLEYCSTMYSSYIQLYTYSSTKFSNTDWCLAVNSCVRSDMCCCMF